MKVNAPRNRLIGDVPKIGIRPTIDGRRQGVRESLQDQTMAKAAAAFLTQNLRHANGLPHALFESYLGMRVETVDTEYFRGGGWSTRFLTRGGMPVTMSRLNLIKGLGPALQIAGGTMVDLPEEVHDALDERTNPTWPTTWFVPRLSGSGPFRDVYSVMYNWGANHGAISYGHVGADLITLASMLRIPVYMHNVPETQIFRPSAWTAFGAMAPLGADFRACANFGPLYGQY
jgi:L-fucose isomerase-like protein